MCLLGKCHPKPRANDSTSPTLGEERYRGGWSASGHLAWNQTHTHHCSTARERARWNPTHCSAATRRELDHGELESGKTLEPQQEVQGQSKKCGNDRPVHFWLCGEHLHALFAAIGKNWRLPHPHSFHSSTCFSCDSALRLSHKQTHSGCP